MNPVIQELVTVGTHMSMLLPRLARLSDERDVKSVKELTERWDRAVLGVPSLETTQPQLKEPKL